MSEVRAEMPRNAWSPGDPSMVGSLRAGHVGRRLIGLATRATATIALLSAIAAAPAAADEPWGFEQVTPVVKGGAAVANLDTFQTDERGDTFLYTAAAPFESVPAESAPRYTRYLATRGPSGWSNRGVDVPFAPKAAYFIQSVVATSANLDHALVVSSKALTAGAIENGSNLYMRATRTGALTLVAAHESPLFVEGSVGLQGALSFNYVAPDGRAAIFSAGVPLTPGSPATHYEPVLYSWTAGGGVKAASVLPESEGGVTVAAYSTPTSEVGPRDAAPRSNGMAHIYFAALSGSYGVYVRTGDETRAVSVSRLPGAPGTPVYGEPDAIGDEGRYLLFHTFNGDRLTEDTPEIAGATFLYRYDAADDSLTYIGASDLGSAVRALQMTQDGQTIAFQGTLALEGQGVAGQPNIYIWRRGTLMLVSTADRTFGDVDTGQGPSGAATGQTYLRLLSPDGRYFSFTDNSASVALRTGYDNSQVNVACKRHFYVAPDTCDQVFLFDADTNKLTCVSCPTDGSPAIGHSGDPSGQNYGKIVLNAHQQRTVTSDGTVFFGTPNGLLPEDSNGTDDVYAFHDGKLRLLSRARAGYSSRFLDAAADGKTVFISTDEPIVDADTDTAVDVYMTRLGAGFATSRAPVRPPCSGDDCRAPAVAPGPPPVLASISFVGEAGVPADGKPALSVSASKRARGSVAALSIRVSGPGTVSISGTNLATAKRMAGGKGTYVVKVSLTAKARKALRSKGTVRAKAQVVFAPRGGERVSKTVALTFTWPAAKKQPGKRSATGGR
jgi:hypothetical protein